MARTRVQQSQISGSLSFDDSLAAGPGLAGQGTLVGDLNALRSQINKIIGGANWHEALAGSQDLSDIYGALHVTGSDAALQGALSVVGASTLEGALIVSGNITLGDASSDSITFNAKAATALDMDSHKVVGIAQASASGDALAWGQNASVSDLIVTGGEFLVDASGNVSISGSLKLHGLSDVPGHLYLVGANNQVSASSGLFYDGSMLQVTGSLDVSNGLNVVGGGMTVSGDRLEVTGSLAVTGVSDFGGNVYAAGDLGVSGSLIANSFKINGDVAKRLYIVDSDGSLKDEPNMWFDGSKLYVTGSAELSSNLEVKGGSVTLSNSVSMSSSAANKLVVTASDVVELTGDLKVGGDTIKSSTGDAIQLSGSDVEVLGDLKVTGNDIKSSAGNVVLTLSGADAFFQNNVDVSGNLTVKGAMTYIETENLKVKDSIIHLSTGSNSAVSRGIVLHGGAGSGGDLAVGAKNTGFDFILAKEVSDADVDAGNSEIFSGAKLADAWMGAVKLGGVEGSLSGSLSAVASGLSLSAAADLSLGANGNSIGLMSGAEYTTFDTNFTATTIVGALNELFSSAGSMVKGNVGAAQFTGNTLDFSSVGTLNVVDQKCVDIYLNGVLLVFGAGKDVVSIDSSTTATLDSGIVSSLIADDVLTVVLRGAA